MGVDCVCVCVRVRVSWPFYNSLGLTEDEIERKNIAPTRPGNAVSALGTVHCNLAVAVCAVKSRTSPPGWEELPFFSSSFFSNGKGGGRSGKTWKKYYCYSRFNWIAGAVHVLGLWCGADQAKYGLILSKVII